MDSKKNANNPKQDNYMPVFDGFTPSSKSLNRAINLSQKIVASKSTPKPTPSVAKREK